MVWGTVLLLPGDLFAGIERYRLIGQLFPDWMWGLLMFCGGALTLLPTPDWIHKHTHWIMCSIWLGLTILSLLGNKSAPAILIATLTFTIAMFHVGKFWRISHPPLVRL